MTQEQEAPELEEALEQIGPGRRLREARETSGLTLQQVAMQLRMQVRIIEALESDDYSSLPGATFVQGYLRSYARLLGLPEESIVAQAPGKKEEPELVGSIYDGKAEVSSRDLPFRMVSFLILVAGVIGLGWWFSQQLPGTDTTAPQPSTSSGEQGLWLPAEGESQLQGTESVTLPAAASAEGEESGVEAVPTETDAGAAEDAVAPVAEAEPEPEAEPVTPAPAVVKPRAEAPEPPPLTNATPQSVLELEFQADCWSDISDAAGRKLAYGLIHAGEKLTLHGEAPFKVFLGFATGVTVYYNGELYDHSPFQRGDVARFRVGMAEHNHPLSGN